ncbi:MAG: Uma2 family endonuclease, partial [Gemmataceae bacterium]
MSTELLDLPMMLGGIDPTRIVLHPATEADLLASGRKGLELIDGVLVEKTMGSREGFLGMWLGTILANFVFQRDLGIVGGADTYFRIGPKRVRVPDVCYVSWERLPNDTEHLQSVSEMTPDLAIEVLSESNTKGEMRLKRQHFFAAGTLVIWEVDPVAETVTVYEPSGRGQVLTVADTLVCPG